MAQVLNSARPDRRPSEGGGAHNISVTPPPSHLPKSRPDNTADCIPFPSVKPKQECDRNAMLMAVLQSPISRSAIITVETLNQEPLETVELQTSDEDEVVEVALPPRPTICIESSDEDEHVQITSLCGDDANTDRNDPKINKNEARYQQRDGSASPAPSVVSSISDEFIRGDCLAFNITRRQEVHRFDFNLHGTDLIDHESNNTLSQNTKKINKKRNKDKSANSTMPNLNTPEKKNSRSKAEGERRECFATPKNKAKKKQDESKRYIVTEFSTPNPDIYETDSNQSAIESNAETPADEQNSSAKDVNDYSDPPAQAEPAVRVFAVTSVQQELEDLTEKENSVIDHLPIENNIVMGNVIGLETAFNYDLPDDLHQNDQSPSVANAASSNNSPPALREESNSALAKAETQRRAKRQKRAKRRKHSASTAKAEMDRFYNESWGGENFNHHEILRQLPRDKKLWAIDPKDRMPPGRRRTCNYCNQPGHRDDRCRRKPRLCYMCGQPGHLEPRCPNRMCMNCGSPNHIYSARCRSCANWVRIFCEVCQQYGHPPDSCPDLWRRYHNTTDNNVPLERQTEKRRYDELFCSGCTKRGHLAHVCRNTLPYNNLPIHSPFVHNYNPVYPPTPAPAPPPNHYNMYKSYSARPEPPRRYFNISPEPNATGDQYAFQNYVARNPNKSQSGPVTSNLSGSEASKIAPKRPLVTLNTPDNFASKRRSLSSSENVLNNPSKVNDNTRVVNHAANNNKEGVLQDSQVSNTSDTINTAKLYITKEVMDKLSTGEGSRWLATTTAKSMVEVRLDEGFVHIKGLMANQDLFKFKLKEWVQKLEAGCSQENDSFNQKETSSNIREFDFCTNIPHKKLSLLRMLTQAFSVLQSDLGDPKAIYKKLQFQKNYHKRLLKTKVISHKKLSNSTYKINEILKNLNMILLGQAGLAEGSQHVSELYSLHNVLTKYRKKLLPREIRQKIGEHYHFVFNSLPRDDYSDLLKKFYGGRHNVKPSNIINQRKNMIQFNKTFQEAQCAASAGAPSHAGKDKTPKKNENNEKIELIKSCQKKLRKISVGNEVTEQSRHMLLRRLRKFQVQIKRSRLFPKQQIQLDKLTAEVNRFLAEL